MSFTFTASQTILAKDLADLIVTAFEGGSAYWCQSAKLIKFPEYDPGPDPGPRYSHPQVYEGDFQFEVGYDDPDGVANADGKKLIGPAEMQAGLTVFAEKYPSHFADFIKEEYDAETADVFWQCVVLGDLVYG